MSRKNDYARGGTRAQPKNVVSARHPKPIRLADAFNWIAKQSTIDASEKALLHGLVSVANSRNGQTYASVDTIGGRCGRARRWVFKFLARLEERGLVHRTRRWGRTSIIVLTLPFMGDVHGRGTIYPTNTQEVCFPSESVRNSRTPSHESGEYSSVEGVGWPEGERKPIPRWKSREYLHAAGVRGSTLDRLSRHQAITAERVLAEVHEIKMKPHGIRDRVRVLIHRLQVAAGIQIRQRQGSDLVRAASSDPALERLRATIAARSASTTAWVRPS